MAQKKQRIEIPSDIATDVLFESDRTCCVCRLRGKPVQLHDMDDDPSNSSPENLAVLCFDCHRDTQIRGGFDRKLDAAQVKKYKADWIKRVQSKRDEQGAISQDLTGDSGVLRYLQIREKSEEHSYEFEADYPLIGTGDSPADSEINLFISTLVTRQLQHFRAEAISRTAMKNDMTKGEFSAIGLDGLVMSHEVVLFTRGALSIEFQLESYVAGAAHPNTGTKTQNFQRQPPLELALRDLFRESSKYLEILSQLCIADLQKQKCVRWAGDDYMTEQLKNLQDGWILSGAGPAYKNFTCFSLRNNGIVIHFDTYTVGSHAEGKYTVFIPDYELKPVIREEVAGMLGWR
ncbi:MAG TPA: DUF3298 domain-containing protein [Candidatus Angelobacter sp.]|jgi:hypothetical protein|nr:DUF3298 domain-containing protein [Candidatus Angelobacter sp.]